MRTRIPGPALLLSLLALAACGPGKKGEQTAQNTPKAPAAKTAPAATPVRAATADSTRPSVDAPEPLELTFEQLQAGGRVLIRNPVARDSVRILVEDASASAPLSQLLKSEQKVAVRRGSARQPGVTTVRLAADALARPAKDSLFVGWVLVDDGRPDPYRHRVHIRVAAPRPASALGDTGSWTASVYKLAPLPGVRARLFDNAEARCSRDTKHRAGLTATQFSRQMNELMGVCLRDNVIPLAGARTDSARRKMEPPPAQTLLGVLRAEDGGDEGLVWWTGDTLAAGPRNGVELHFTSLDRPGAYRGRISLAGAGADGVVNLNVQVTHDWPLALVVIVLGVLLSTWLRGYVRTRRAVLDLQVASTALMSRITRADRVLRQLDSPEPGKHPYKVDVTLRRDLQQIERRIQQLARDGAALEPGKPDHDALRKELDACYDRVTAWEDFADLLRQLREDLDVAAGCARELGRGDATLPDVPPLLADAEKHFAGVTVVSADLPAVRDAAAATADTAAAWREAAEAAVALRRSLADSKVTPPPGSDRAKAAATLDAAVLALWAATERTAAEAAGVEVHRAEELFIPRQRKVPALKVVRDLGRVVGGALGTGAGLGTLTTLEMATDFRLGTGSLEGTGTGREMTPAEREALSSAAAAQAEKRTQERQRQAVAEQKRSDTWYFLITTAVAVATGLSEVYLKDPSFGTMRDYMTALLWGFGTKMGLDTVRAAVESGRLPWSKGTAPAEATQQAQQAVQGAAAGAGGGAAAAGNGASGSAAAAGNAAAGNAAGDNAGAGNGAGGTTAAQAQANAAAAAQGEKAGSVG